MAEAQIIDVKSIFVSKNPKLAKFIPEFIYNYIKRTIHQDEINHVLTKYKDSVGVEFVSNTLKELGFTYKSEGIENIPKKGRYIFVSNHPLGGLDGLVLMNEISTIFPEIKFFVNDLLLNLKNLAPIFIPINKSGKQSTTNFKLMEETFASESSQILYFPAGLCSRKTNGVICDLEWKKSFIDKAIKHQRNIIPIFFEGRNSNFFYNLSSIRKAFGIKANIEMFYLPDEMFNQRSKTMVLKFGKVIPYTIFDKSKTTKEWADIVKKHVYTLSSNYNNEFKVK